MTSRDQIIEAMARRLFVMQHRVDAACFDKHSYAPLAEAATREADNAFAVALPLIREALAEKVRDDLVYTKEGTLNTFNSGQEYAAGLIMEVPL